MEVIDRFAEEMHVLWREGLPERDRWERVRDELVPMLLEDDELRASAATLEDTHGEGDAATTTNLLLYEDPHDGFVIYALVKASGGTVIPHDHAQAWTVYGVIEGTERIERYELVEGDRDSERVVLRRIEDTLVGSGTADLVGPYEIHAEQAESGRTVAVIVRSQPLGLALHAAFDPETGAVVHVHGPRSVPYALD